MNGNAANVIVNGFLKGTLDVYDALLSLSFSYEVTEVSDLSREELDDVLASNSAAMRGKILGGGAIVLLTSVEEASKLIALTNTGEPTTKDALDDGDLATFQEIAMSALGGGVSNLTEQFGADVEFEGTDATVLGPGSGSDFLDYFGAPECTIGRFQFDADPHFNATGVLIYSQILEDRVPDELLGDEGPLVSDDEMEDILSGFDSGDLADTTEGEYSPKNIDMVLDIELVATARLGKMEMAIADILELGPGSIIEVGQLVDEPVELLVNDKLVARGDVVVVDEKFGLRITEIVSRKERIESMR